MSLTHIIRDPMVRDRIRSVYTKPRISSKGTILAEPQSKAYGLVGTAFDYLLRFEVNRRNPSAISGPWVAEYAKVRLPLLFSEDVIPSETDTVLGKQVKLADEIVERAKASSTHYVCTGEVTEALFADAISLAKLDVFFRSAWLDEDLGGCNPRDIADLRTLLSVVPSDLFYARRHCVLNPEFKEGTALAEGAEADLLVDDALIEIKTTKSRSIRPEHFDQLIAYLALAHLYGVDGLSAKPRIKKIGIYYSRYGDYLEFALKDILDGPGFREFLKWFGLYLAKHEAKTMELVINGDTVAEPVTDTLIGQSINALTGEGDSFAILEKASETYMQTSGGPSCGFVLEYRNGSESEHYSCSKFELTADEVIWAFQSYFADDGQWETKLEWQPLVFD